MLQVFGWIAWAAVVFLAVSWTIGCRTKARSSEGFSWAAGIQTLSFYVMSILFLVSDWNKLHMFWLIPAVISGAPFIALSGIVGVKAAFLGLPLPLKISGAPLIALGVIPGLSQLVMALTRLFVSVIPIGIPRRDDDEPPPDLLDETGSFKPRDQLTPEQQRRADEYWTRQTEQLRRMRG